MVFSLSGYGDYGQSFLNAQLEENLTAQNDGLIQLFDVSRTQTLQKLGGNRAVGTFIPQASPVIQTVLKKETFFGRAFVVNDWYLTAYEPIIIEGEVQGILYVGVKEKDLSLLHEAVRESAGNIDEGARSLDENFQNVGSISAENKDGMEEINSGVTDVFASVQSVNNGSSENVENMKTISERIGKFKTS